MGDVRVVVHLASQASQAAAAAMAVSVTEDGVERALAGAGVTRDSARALLRVSGGPGGAGTGGCCCGGPRENGTRGCCVM